MISKKTLEKLAALAANDEVLNGITPERAYLHLGEEVGELGTAISVEGGYKKRELSESAHCEAVDVIIMGLTMFHLTGGEMSNLETLMLAKLAKWEKRVYE